MHHSIQTFKKIISNVEKVIVGKREAIELLVTALVCEGHVLIEDVPGVGKTSLVSSLAKSINASFRRIQFTPDIMPSDITGFSMYNPKTGEFQFRPGVIMSQIILADEINRTSPKTQASLLEVMEEHQVTVDGTTYPVPQPFMVMATQNPIEYLGTFPLPEAQLDRFFMKISLGYPTNKEESTILSNFQQSNPLSTLEAVASEEDIIELQKIMNTIYVDQSLNDYVVKLVSETRKHPDVLLGASPRASLFLSKAARAWALYNGRNYVLPDDIQKMFIPVLSHRIILNQEAKLKKISTDVILSSIMQRVVVPVVDINEKK